MNYGFVIDQRKCIGCHACTVACKAENDVPVGVFRTWVKYVEKGEFPNTRRHFSVMRCNHCADAPCVAICPTKALYTRHDGIVDFDNQRCIGCKSCMAACPYDAIYLHPDDHTAAKCNYCAHRVDVGLQPACVLVCPVQAIVSGDLDDSSSAIARLVAREPVRARKPEQGTKPKLFYIGADEASLLPETVHVPEQYMWAEVQGGSWESGAGSREPETATRVVYNVGHEMPWEHLVSGYLWTKSIAAGALIVAGGLLGLSAADGLMTLAAPLLALVFLALTTALLVADLGKPLRFIYILTKPNFTSWLVWGSYILMAFALVALIWLAGFARVMAWPAVALGIATAVYSGFLFGQAEARDFWQTPLLPIHLFVQAVAAGSAVLLLIDRTGVLAAILAAALVAHLLFVLAEVVIPHANLVVARSSELVARSAWFWGLAIAAGIAAPLALLAVGLFPAAGVLAVLGLLVYEDIWVRAGQGVPLS